ncbi:sigma-54-dependent transcriptional regulator [Desulfurivibrio alkaliphilus]|uniref:Two component, sigma54 specific, transcriptional regulator, Fis family n=1 Tax=Desulfurivibrio alkaliphilus (strain DSM 19089 / UNIQEM U267 / AHT2) TaxID=589865 RepID=D6Z075_DESAT|nr:sigma-54 dependent transcriptional regulator [Desulfurivibrio alkaliphilus]ADH87108.1 two component, sigma54 specific, transcriptional regulator, Fis family [Desulfurivibrio alkaliphilus AHT 2]
MSQPSDPILVIDDDLRMRQLLRDTLASAGFTAELCADGREAAQLLQSRSFNVILTDLQMPHFSGIEILEQALAANPDSMVVLVTGHGTVESAVEAIKKGAYDYIQKPFEPDELLLTVQRATEHARLRQENRRLQQQVAGCRGDELVGESPPLKKLKELIAQVAPFSTTVLINGETGTGKELAAKLIHKWSGRHKQPFLAINCGALPETLLESELFGHVKGAFTGADQDKPGLFETVDQGTLFLDEIDSMTLNFQVKLLRVLQEGTFLKVGGRQPCRADVRVIAASSRPLSEGVAAGSFRRDLFYRLNVVSLELPPLRQRREDIPLLAHHFLAKYNAKYDKQVQTIPAPVITRLLDHSWPGNVRELENAVERALLFCPGQELQAEHLPPLETGGEEAELHTTADDAKSLTMASMEKKLIIKALQRANGHRGKTAELLGISPASLWRKIKKYEINTPS